MKQVPILSILLHITITICNIMSARNLHRQRGFPHFYSPQKKLLYLLISYHDFPSHKVQSSEQSLATITTISIQVIITVKEVPDISLSLVPQMCSLNRRKIFCYPVQTRVDKSGEQREHAPGTSKIFLRNTKDMKLFKRCSDHHYSQSHNPPIG